MDRYYTSLHTKNAYCVKRTIGGQAQYNLHIGIVLVKKHQCWTHPWGGAFAWVPPTGRASITSWLFFCLFFSFFCTQIYILSMWLVSRTSPLESRVGSGCRGQTSGACVSPPEPGVRRLLSPPGTGLSSPHLQTP